MKKLINAPERFVADTLTAFAQVHGELVRADLDNTVCLRREPLPRGHVALISGGGSGHEPLHAGFVGDGMLAAAVLGDIFASPNADQVLAACTPSDAGPGRRGTAATVFVEKIAGALAAEGAPLAEVKAIAERVVDASRSIGFALTSCTTPMARRPTFALGPDEIEFGVGIHGEQGIGRRRMATARELAEAAIDHLLDDLNPDFGAELLMLTNGLGGTPESELYLLHGEAARILTERGGQVVRHLVGPYVTSLDMAGASISLLVLDEELKRLWDAPATTAALSR